MKIIFLLLPCLILGCASLKPPRNMSEVEASLQKEGADHLPIGMDIDKEGYTQVGDTYFHVFSGEISEDDYHIIIFDNSRNYLGYYPARSGISRLKDNWIYLDRPKTGDEILSIGVGNYGPFMKFSNNIGSAAKIITLVPSSKYSDDGYNRYEFRDWTFPSGTINARFMMYDESRESIYLEMNDTGVVRAYLYKIFKGEDRSYIMEMK